MDETMPPVTFFEAYSFRGASLVEAVKGLYEALAVGDLKRAIVGGMTSYPMAGGWAIDVFVYFQEAADASEKK